MTEREKEILRMALLYMQANLSDAIELFTELECEENQISVNGDAMATPTDREVCALLDTLQ